MRLISYHLLKVINNLIKTKNKVNNFKIKSLFKVIIYSKNNVFPLKRKNPDLMSGLRIICIMLIL